MIKIFLFNDAKHTRIYIMHTCVTRSSLDPFPSQRTLGVETDSGNLVNRNNKARKAGSSSFSRDGRGVHKVICASATSARTSKKFGLPAPPTLAHRRSVQLVSRSFRPLSTNISYILYISCITHSYIRGDIYIHTHIHTQYVTWKDLSYTDLPFISLTSRITSFYLFLSFSLSIYLSICLTLSLYLFLILSIFLSLSFFLSVSLSLSLSFSLNSRLRSSR